MCEEKMTVKKPHSIVRIVMKEIESDVLAEKCRLIKKRPETSFDEADKLP